MPRRLNGGLAVAAIGAVLLIVSLFLHWFAPARSAWRVFEIQDLILFCIGLGVVANAVADAFQSADKRLRIPQGSVLFAGIAALIIVAADLIQPPPTALHSSREVGAWLALLAAALITAGGFLMRARVSLVISLRGAERPRRAQNTQDMQAYDAPAAYEPEDEDLEAYAAEPGPQEYEPEESSVDPDTETRRFSPPPG